jgi:hypothetical protein
MAWLDLPLLHKCRPCSSNQRRKKRLNSPGARVARSERVLATPKCERKQVAVRSSVLLDAFINSPKVWRNLRSGAITESSKRNGLLFIGRRHNSERFQRSRIEFVNNILAADPPSAPNHCRRLARSTALGKADRHLMISCKGVTDDGVNGFLAPGAYNCGLIWETRLVHETAVATITRRMRGSI